MSEIRVTFGAIEAARADVASTAVHIGGQLEDLRRFLAPMVAGWEGQAASDYQLTQRRWDVAAADLAAVLARIGVALGTANDSYRQVEQANAARWR